MQNFPVPRLQITVSKLSETVELDKFYVDFGLDLEDNNLESIFCLGELFASVAPVISPADAQVGNAGVSRSRQGTVGLRAFVVDAAPCDACAMSESLHATFDSGG